MAKEVEFIFVRHGQSDANAAGILATPDAKLTELGITQARETGRKLKTMGIKQVVCSPYLRAQQTAEIIAGELGIDIAHIQVINELHERKMGKFEGTRKTHDKYWYESHPGDDDFEHQASLFQRGQICIDKIRNLSAHGLVVAVGHACSGLYMVEGSKGYKRFADFEGKASINNADFIRVKM